MNINQNSIQKTLRLDTLALKNYREKFSNDEVLEETSSFVELFRNNKTNKRIIVKKTTFCWLLRNDHVRLSSDRLERVKADTKIKSKKVNNHSLNVKPLKRLTKTKCKKIKM